MPDDPRDIRTPKVPPAAVRAQTADPEHEFSGPDLTPVDGMSLPQETNHRATSAAVDSRIALSLIARLQKEQETSTAEVRAYAAADKADHAEMKGEIRQIKDHVGDVRETLGKVSGQLQILVGDRSIQQKTDAHERSATLEYTLDVKKSIWKTVLKVFGVVFGGIAGFYVAKYFQ